MGEQTMSPPGAVSSLIGAMVAMICLMIVAALLMQESGSPPSGNGRHHAAPPAAKSTKAPGKRAPLQRARTADRR